MTVVDPDAIRAALSAGTLPCPQPGCAGALRIWSPARTRRVQLPGTMWLITNAVRDGLLTKPAATKMVDLLAATDMALPTDGAGFFTWAYEEGLLP